MKDARKGKPPKPPPSCFQGIDRDAPNYRPPPYFTGVTGAQHATPIIGAMGCSQRPTSPDITRWVVTQVINAPGKSNGCVGVHYGIAMPHLQYQALGMAVVGAEGQVSSRSATLSSSMPATTTDWSTPDRLDVGPSRWELGGSSKGGKGYANGESERLSGDPNSNLPNASTVEP